MKAVSQGQLDTSKLMRVIALLCIALALFMGALEATHSHSDGAVARNSSPCAICLSVHANAPTVTVYLLEVSHAVEALTVPYESQGKSTVSELSLFIRPPPIA
jgi:hypothetical protein